MKRNPLYRLVLRLCAPKIVRDIYRGVLGREPDRSGLQTYRQQLLATGDVAGVVASISASPEAWHRNLRGQPAELARLVLRGLQGREPDQAAVDACAAQLDGGGDLAKVLRAQMSTRGHWETLMALRADEVVALVFEALLGRAPDADALRFYGAQLKERKDLSWLLAAVAQSEEHGRKQVAQQAEELLRMVYVGLLNREPEPEAVTVYGSQLRDTADLSGLIRSVAQSREHWESVLNLRAEELVEGVCQQLLPGELDEHQLDAHVMELRGSKSLPQWLSTLTRSEAHWERLLESKAGELARAACESLLGVSSAQVVENYAAQLKQHRNLHSLLAALACSHEHWEHMLALKAEDLVGTVYESLLKRPPDGPALSEYGGRLRQSRDLRAVLSAVAESPEHWDRLVALKAEELVGIVYQGLLKRAADKRALRDYGSELREGKDLAALVSAVAESPEHWRRLVTVKAEELVREVYRGLLKREPDEEALRAYAEQLSRGEDLSAVLSAVAESTEHWRNLLGLNAKEVVTAVYRGLLRRDPDGKGFVSHVDGFGLHRDLSALVAAVSDSREYREFLTKEHTWPHPRRTYSRNTLVFLHMEKTAGTSVQNILRDAFGAEQVYGENHDTLHLHSPGELSQYSVFAGHFNHDSLIFIPRQKLSLISFVREPRKRLASAYHFWRAHEPSHPNYKGGVALANRLSIQEFFARPGIEEDWGIWNHMTWAIMGERRWREWRLLLTETRDKRSEAEILTRVARPAIAQRVREFLCVGIQEDFDRSVELLFRVLERPAPKIRMDHSLEGLMLLTPGFKRKLPRQRITAEVDATLDRLVALDNIVYSEARSYYAELLAKFLEPNAALGREAGTSRAASRIWQTRKRRS